MGSSKKNQTVTSNPWEPAAEGVRPAIDASRRLMFDASGNLITQPTDLQRQAVQGMYDYSQNDPMQAGAMDYYSGVLGGETNPYLDQMFNKAAGNVRSKLDSQFEAAGRYGSYDHAREMGDAYNNLASEMYGGQYNADEARRMQVAQIAPSAGYAGFQRQLGAADALEGFDYDQQMNQIRDYLGMMSPMLGAGGTQTTPIYRDNTSMVLGGLGSIGGLLSGIGAL